MSLGWADFPEESLSVSGQEDKDLAANVLGAAWGRRPGCPQPPAQDIQFLCAYTPPSPGTSGSPPVQRPSGSFFPEGKPWTRARVAGGRRGSKCFCDGPWATSTVLSFTSTPRGTCSWQLPNLVEILRWQSASRDFCFLGFAEFISVWFPDTGSRSLSCFLFLVGFVFTTTPCCQFHGISGEGSWVRRFNLPNWAR